MNILLINPAPTGTLKATGVLFPPFGPLYIATHFSFIRLEWLLFKMHLLYYTRSRKAIQDIWNHIKKHHLGIGTFSHFFKDYFRG